MEDENDIVQRFISRMEQLKQEAHSNYDIYTIVSDLGYTDKDLEIVKQYAQKSIIRSKEYLKQGMLKDAEAEALIALDMFPNDAEVYVLLGSVYKAFSRKKLFPFGYYSKALSMYKKALTCDVSQKAAFDGIKEVQGIKRLYVVKVISFLCLCGAFFFFVLRGRYSGQIGDKELPVLRTQTNESKPKSIAENSNDSFVAKKEIPITVIFPEKLKGLQFITQSSVLLIYQLAEPSFSVIVKGLIASENIEVFNLEFEIAWYGSDGNVLKTKSVSVIDTYHASLKPHEVYPVNIFEYSKGAAPDIKKIVITPTLYDAEPAQEANLNTKLSVIWAQKPEADKALDVYLRNSTVVSGVKDYIGKTVLVFYNSGSSRINLLKVRILYKKDNEIIVRGKEIFVLTNDRGYIPSQAKFSYQILDQFPKDKFQDQYAIYDTIEVEVLQIE
ncbi:MAG TPA: hypothetical protein P5519_08375 [Spirochaetia bacterium]|nr:hypothetical protein [Spirochaetales bacterium]HQK34947.1 hypothetical protein [Spirochaetales bacterium]HRS65890.1 hypothetical protein [Spirochaetia bacterium]HRV29129.1 hypothetical protein [Spirochaetia bacterium]